MFNLNWDIWWEKTKIDLFLAAITIGPTIGLALLYCFIKKINNKRRDKYERN